MNTLTLSIPRKIFLGVDGSDHAVAAARLLSELPLEEKCTVTILSVLTPMQTPGLSVLLAAQDKAEAVFQNSGVSVNTGILHGHPAKAMVAFAEEHNPDLLVVGAKGLRATLGILLGGVAQQMAEYAEQSVLIVRKPYEGLRRVLLTVDGSAVSEKAVEYLRAFPLPHNVQIDVLHVLPPFPSELEAVEISAARMEGGALKGAQQIPRTIERRFDEEEEDGKELLEKTAHYLRERGWEVNAKLVRGDAATEILSHIEEKDIDLVVAGSRGLSQLRGWLLGSVSRKLIHYADSSVLIVK